MYEWIANAVLQTAIEQKKMHEDREYLRKQFERLEKQINERFDEQIRLKFQAALRHLVDGQNSDVEDVRADEFRMARTKFGELIGLSSAMPVQPSTIREGGISLVVALSHWGNYYYFLLRGDERNSLIQVYECTKLYPLLGLHLFSPSFFSRAYQEQLTKARADLVVATETYDRISGKNRKEKRVYKWKQTGLQLSAAAVGFGVGGVLGLLTVGPGAVGGAMAYKAIVDGNKDGIRKPELLSTTEWEQRKQDFTRLIESTLNELIQECEERKAHLEKTTLAEMLRLTKL
jgi:hypothetical protein